MKAVSKTLIVGALCGLPASSGLAMKPDILWQQEKRLSLNGRIPSTAVVYSPDGQWIASAQPSRVEIRTARDRKLIRTLSATENGTQNMAFTPDSQKLVVSGFEGRSFSTWEVSTGRRLGTFQGFVNFQKGILSPDGRFAAISESSAAGVKIHIYRLEDQKLLFTVRNSYEAAFSRDGETAAIITGREIRLYRVSDGSLRRKLNYIPSSFGYTSLPEHAFSPDGNHLLIKAHSDTIVVTKLYDLNADKVLRSFSNLNAVLFSPGSHTMAISPKGDSRMEIWSVVNPKQLQLLREGLPIAFSPDGAELAFAGRVQAEGTYFENVPISFLRLSDESIAEKASEHNGIASLVIAPDGKTLASGTHDGNIFVWKTENGERLHKLEGGWGRISYSADGKRIIADTDQPFSNIEYREWSLEDGSLVVERAGENSVTLSPDGRLAAHRTAADVIQIQRIDDGQTIQTINGDGTSIRSYRFTPDSRHFIYYASNGKLSPGVQVYLWSVEEGRTLLLGSYERGRHLLSPDGQSVILVGHERPTPNSRYDSLLSIYRIPDGKLLNSVRLSPKLELYLGLLPGSGHYATYNAAESALKLWDLMSGERIQSFPYPQALVQPTLFTLSPDQRTLAVSSPKRLDIWRVSDGKLLQTYDEGVEQIGQFAFSPEGNHFAYSPREGSLIYARLTPQGSLTPGDLDDSGQIDVQDVILALKFIHLSVVPTVAQTLAADLDGDHVITLADAVRILRKAIGAD